MNNQTPFLQFLICLLYFLSVINVCTSTSEYIKKSIDDPRDDNGDPDDTNDSMDIAVDNDNNINITCSRRSNSEMHEIRSAESKQFPFVGAIMSHENEYLCAGSVVSNGLLLTTAKCTQQSVSYVLLNTTRDKRDGAVMLHVIKTEKFPTFSGSDSLKDVGLIYTEKHNSSIASKIKLSNYTSARSLVDVEAIGFGLNAEIGQVKELQYIGMELRSPLESGDILKAYFDCIETKVSTCFKDTGGPVIFDNELVGIIIQGQEDCTKEMSATYAINKKMADILPTFTFKAWLDEKIKKNEESEESDLTVFPMQPSLRRSMKPAPTVNRKNEVRFSSANNLKSPIQLLLLLYPVLAFL